MKLKFFELRKLLHLVLNMPGNFVGELRQKFLIVPIRSVLIFDYEDIKSTNISHFLINGS